jgi:HSP20 family molecular chaperone IbpA
MGLELVREFDCLAKKLYSVFNDDLNEYTESEIYVGIRSDVVREEAYIVVPFYSVAKPNKNTTVRKFKRKIKYDNTIRSRNKKVGQNTSEDLIVSDKNIKVVFQLPINNKKENIKVIANDDYSITLSHLNNEGKRCTRTLEIPYNTEFENAKATFKNGILEVTFDRK